MSNTDTSTNENGCLRMTSNFYETSGVLLLETTYR